MTSERLEDVLEESLRMMEAGVSLDDCVLRHPAHAEELRGQLAVAQALRATSPVAPETAAVARARALLLSSVTEQRAPRNGHRPTSALPLPGAGGRRLLLVPYALPAALALVLLGGAALGVSAATGNADPLDWFVPNGSHARIEVRGVISAIDAGSLTVDTDAGPVQVLITPDTEFEGDDGRSLTAADFAVGDVVKVQAARAEDGSLIAREVEIEGLDDGDGDDNSGPGAVDDDADNSGPGSVDDGADEDNSGPRSVDDGEDDDDGGRGTDEDGRDEGGGPGSVEDEGDESNGPGAGDDEGDDDAGPGSVEDGDDSSGDHDNGNGNVGGDGGRPSSGDGGGGGDERGDHSNRNQDGSRQSSGDDDNDDGGGDDG